MKINLLFLILFTLSCASTLPPVGAELMLEPISTHLWVQDGTMKIKTPDGSYGVHYRWDRKNSKRTKASFSAMAGFVNANVMFTDEVAVIKLPFTSDVLTVINNQHSVAVAIKQEFTVPLKQFNYWMTGEIYPDDPIHDIIKHSNGTIDTLQQSGWTILFNDYRRINGYLLPTGLKIYNFEHTVVLKTKSKTFKIKN